MAGGTAKMAMHYALCNFDGKPQRTSSVPTRTRCIFKIMHFRHMHYYNFYCNAGLQQIGVLGERDNTEGRLDGTPRTAYFVSRKAAAVEATSTPVPIVWGD